LKNEENLICFNKILTIVKTYFFLQSILALKNINQKFLLKFKI